MIRAIKKKSQGVLLFAAALLTACSSEDVDIVQQQTWHVSIPVDESHATRSVFTADGGASLKSKWTSNQSVEAYSGDTKVGDLTAAENASGGSTTIIGDISGTYTAGVSTLTLYSPAMPTSATHNEYATQDGTIDGENGISKHDYLKANINVTAVDGNSGVLLTSNASFQRLQSFTKFTFSVAVKEVVISATGMDDITVTASTDQTDFYVALPLEGSKEYTFVCTTNGGEEYRATKAGNLVNGNYYIATVSVATGLGVSNTSPWGENHTENTTIYF